MLELHSPLAAHLSAFADLGIGEKTLLETTVGGSVRRAAAHHDIVREGQTPRWVRVLLEGWAMGYRQLPGGRRQILALMLPGDICEAQALVGAPIDFSLGALTPVHFAEVAPADFEALLAASPRLARALRRKALATAAIQRQWTTNVGQRHAYERVAHLLCETFARLEAIGLTRGEACEFPLTQTDIADATGLTPVHVNRMVQALRHDGLIELRDKRLRIHDQARLRQAALFDPAYLHL